MINAQVLAQTEPRALAADWRDALPVLTGRVVALRELELGDAPALKALLAASEVARFISPPPLSVEAFERFIMWAHHERRRGAYLCFAVVPHGMTSAVGLFQVRQLAPGFATAEWGFALDTRYWGSGAFRDGAELTVDFAFSTLGVRRLEARAAAANGRGNGALRKMAAVPEAVLRQAFVFEGEYSDQVLRSIVDCDWRQLKGARECRSAVH